MSPQLAKKISEKYNIDLLIVFGSTATSQTNHLSDLDLAFYQKKQMSPEKEQQLLEDIMYENKRADIDLININKTHKALLLYQIFMHGKPLYEKDEGLFDRMKYQAYFDFEDFKRFYSQKKDLIDKKIEDLIT